MYFFNEPVCQKSLSILVVLPDGVPVPAIPPLKILKHASEILLLRKLKYSRRFLRNVITKTMADKTKIIEDTKQIISSILASEKYGLTLPKLEQTHEEFVGYGIPYRKMGFNSALDFFRDISDVVRVSYTSSGLIQLDVVSNEKIARVRKLVERQKDSVRDLKTKRVRLGLPPVRGRGGRGGRGGGRYGGGGRSGGGRGGRSYGSGRFGYGFVPAGYEAYEPEPMFFGYGAPSGRVPPLFEDQFMPRGRSGYSVPLPPKVKEDPPKRLEAETHGRAIKGSSSQATKGLSSQATLSQHRETTTRAKAEQQKSSSLQKPATEQPEEVNRPKINFEEFKPSEKHAPQAPTVPATIRGRLRDLLLDYPNGMLISKFQDVYNKRYQASFNLYNLGFNSAIEMFITLTDIVDLEELSSGDVRIRTKKLQQKSGSLEKRDYTQYEDMQEALTQVKGARESPSEFVDS